MASTPGATSASKATLRAPFPRTNNTVKPPLAVRRPSTTSTSSSATYSDTVHNQRISMPSSSISGSMGPPPVGGRRNERFDHLFYTSPLPRSISRAYNSLQASGGAASVTTAADTTRTTKIVPSALRMGVMTDGINIGVTGVVPRRAPADIGTAKVDVSQGPSRGKVVATRKEAAGAVGGSISYDTRESGVLSMNKDKPQTTKTPITGDPTPTERLKKGLPSVPGLLKPSTQAFKEDEDMVMGDISDENEWNISARKENRVYRDTQEKEEGGGGDDEATLKVLVQAIKRSHKHPISNSPPPTSPRKVPKTASFPSSPGKVRGTRSIGKRGYVKPRDSPGTALGGEQVNQRPKEKKQKGHSEPPKSSSSLLHNQNQPDSPTPGCFPSQSLYPPSAKTHKRERATSTLPGFEVPPGILDETGSLWDSESGRRLSSRVSAGLPSSSSLPSSGPFSAEKRVGKDYAFSGKLKEQRFVSGGWPLPSGKIRGRKYTRNSFSGISSESRERDRRITSLRSNSTSDEKQARRLARSSLGSGDKEKEVRRNLSDRSSSSGGETIVSTPPISTRSSFTGKENEKVDTQGPSKHGKSLEKKKTALSKFQQQPDNDTIPPTRDPLPRPPSLPLKKTRRSIQSPADLASVPRTTTSTTPGSQNQTPYQTTTKKASHKPSWVIEETPQTTSVSKLTGLARSWIDPGLKPDKTRVIDETPQPEKTKRITRTSTGLKVQNQEFEFSDDEG